MNLVEENMTPFQKKVFCIIDTAIEEEQGLKQVCDELLSLASDEIIQKPAWSKEDERHVNSLLKRLEGLCRNEFERTRFAINEDEDWLKSLRPQKKEALPQWRRLPLNGVSYAPDYWCVMDVITSTVGANSTSVSALVKGDYYVPLFELEKFIRNI